MSMNKTDSRLKIAYLTHEHAYDKRSFSGTLYYMGQALEQHCGEVTYLERVLSWEKRYVGRIMHEATKHILKRQLPERRLLFIAKKQAKVAARRIAGQQFDVIVAPDCGPAIAFLQTDIPILLPLDVTFRLHRTTYPEFSRLLGITARHGEMIEQIAFQRASKLLFSSSWAARSAIEDYDVDPQKVHVAFFGAANLDHIPMREQVLAKKLSEQCRLLFVGVDWQRKGGDIAYETLLKLHEMGIQAKLTVCGSTPPGIAHEHMTVIPYLNKNDEQQEGEIEKLYAMSDFLILPTRADCMPNVFGEAYAFGVPVITTDTGGIADVVRDGENGYVLPYEARGEAYARVIAELYRDEQRYRQLVKSSRATFEGHLNWNVWGMTVKNILNEMLGVKGTKVGKTDTMQ